MGTGKADSGFELQGIQRLPCQAPVIEDIHGRGEVVIIRLLLGWRRRMVKRDFLEIPILTVTGSDIVELGTGKLVRVQAANVGICRLSLCNIWLPLVRSPSWPISSSVSQSRS